MSSGIIVSATYDALDGEGLPQRLSSAQSLLQLPNMRLRLRGGGQQLGLRQPR